MFKMEKTNPFPALFDDAEQGGYPKSEIGYLRAYFRNGRWYNTCFQVGEFDDKAIDHDLGDIYRQFMTLFPTVGKMTDFCRKNGFCHEEWCGYDQYTAYLETPIALYRFVMRNAPGDYNLYLHCYDRFQIPWSNPEHIKFRVMENYECIEEGLNSVHFDFNVSLPKAKLLEIYAKVQKEINGDTVTYPEGLDEEKYTGNYADFLLSCNKKAGFSRTNDEIENLKFIM